MFRFKIYVNNSRGEKKEEGSLHPSQKPRRRKCAPGGKHEKRKSRNSRRAMKAHQNKVTMIGITFVVCVLMVTLLVQGQKLNAKLSSNQQRTSELEQQIENENQRTEDISEMQEYMQSDEYLEKVAKDKLGLVKDGEIIFKESN